MSRTYRALTVLALSLALAASTAAVAVAAADRLCRGPERPAAA